MRFSYSEAMTDPAYYAPLAQAAEAAGYDSMALADSLIYPRHSDASYPYSTGGDREFLADKPFVETFTLATALGMVTSSIKFTSFVLKLPVRAPVLVAKQAGSVAYLTGNRLNLGVGLSPWPEDYQALGVPWERRGKRMDESIDIVRGLTGGEYFSYDGEIFQVPEVRLLPAPTEPIPILVGGHSKAALTRAVRRGDGWLHAGGSPEELEKLLDQLELIRGEHDHTDKPFEIQVISREAFSVDGVRRLEERGVTEVRVGFRNPYIEGLDQEPLQTKIDMLNKYADKVISKVNG